MNPKLKRILEINEQEEALKAQLKNLKTEQGNLYEDILDKTGHANYFTHEGIVYYTDPVSRTIRVFQPLEL